MLRMLRNSPTGRPAVPTVPALVRLDPALRDRIALAAMAERLPLATFIRAILEERFPAPTDAHAP